MPIVPAGRRYIIDRRVSADSSAAADMVGLEAPSPDGQSVYEYFVNERPSRQRQIRLHRGQKCLGVVDAIALESKAPLSSKTYPRIQAKRNRPLCRNTYRTVWAEGTSALGERLTPRLSSSEWRQLSSSKG